MAPQLGRDVATTAPRHDGDRGGPSGHGGSTPDRTGVGDAFAGQEVANDLALGGLAQAGKGLGQQIRGRVQVAGPKRPHRPEQAAVLGRFGLALQARINVTDQDKICRLVVVEDLRQRSPELNAHFGFRPPSHGAPFR